MEPGLGRADADGAMPEPSLIIDLDIIAANTAEIMRRCAMVGVQVIGVTKATGGLPRVARAMLRGIAMAGLDPDGRSSALTAAFGYLLSGRILG